MKKLVRTLIFFSSTAVGHARLWRRTKKKHGSVQVNFEVHTPPLSGPYTQFFFRLNGLFNSWRNNVHCLMMLTSCVSKPNIDDILKNYFYFPDINYHKTPWNYSPCSNSSFLDSRLSYILYTFSEFVFAVLFIRNFPEVVDSWLVNRNNSAISVWITGSHSSNVGTGKRSSPRSQFLLAVKYVPDWIINRTFWSTL